MSNPEKVKKRLIFRMSVKSVYHIVKGLMRSINNNLFLIILSTFKNAYYLVNYNSG